jgi:trimeric autotransporter adhesin
LLISALVLAQAPDKLSYQALIRDATGTLVTSHSVGMRVSILPGSETGTAVYVETHAATTNTNGLVSIMIGGGTSVTGSFAIINWATGPYFLKTETDPAGGINYTISGTSQLLSVPYALNAKTVGNGFSGSYNDLADKPTLATVATSGSYSDLTNQPTLFNGNYNSLTNRPTIITGTSTATGASALVVNNGARNTAMGYNALSQNTTGSDNTAVGYNVLRYNIPGGSGTGSYNTAIGSDALSSNTVGAANTAIGWMALTANTNGVHNTACGYLTLNENTTGHSNAAVGSVSLRNCTSGHSNAAIGNNALYSDTSGNYNTAAGNNALYSNLRGNHNTASGYSALYSNTNGNNNTAIGYNADVSSENLSNATVIGYNASVTASNNMVFGNSSVVGWGFGVAPGTAAIRVGDDATNGNGATLTLAGVWTNASDSTKKCNIRPINYGLQEVLKLKPVSYQMKGSGYQDIGFIAKDVKLLLPELVYGKEGELSLSYGQITAVLTKAI